jgi:hypothetical protein
MKGIQGEFPYDEYVVYGPILHKSEQRRMVVLIRASDGYRTSTSYARYLMSVHLCRCLNYNEHVDHKDDNKLNDDISNFQILTPKENRSKSARPKTMIELRCDICDEIFFRRKGNCHKGYKHTFCSRTCNGIHWQRTNARWK